MSSPQENVRPRRRISWLIVFAFATLPAHGQAPRLIEDIDTRTPALGSVPDNFALLGDVLYFSGLDQLNGYELWRTDGTAEGTYLVEDICPGDCNSHPRRFAQVGQRLFFVAQQRDRTSALWVTDGTNEGTYPVPGICNRCDIQPASIVELLGKAYFTARHPLWGRELWTSDGTLEGTRLVFDACPGPCGGAGELAVFEDLLLFSGSDTERDFELWRSDGTAGGTSRLRAFRTGLDGSFPTAFTVLGDRMFFVVDGFATEVWKTDGSLAGTEYVVDLPNPNGLRQKLPAVLGNRFFVLHGCRLWRTDGSRGDRTLIREFEGCDAASFHLAATSDALYFRDDTAEAGNELWTSDGTPEGTRMVTDLRAGVAHSNSLGLTSLTDRLVFQATGAGAGAPATRGLWVTDGRELGTAMLRELNVRAFIDRSMGVGGGLVYFQGDDGSTGHELWKSDATPGGTALVRNLNPELASSSPRNFMVHGDAVVFNARDESGIEPRVTRGVPGQTFLLGDLAPSGSSNVLERVSVGDTLYLAAAQQRLWRSDALAEPVLVQALPGIHNVTLLGSRLFFAAHDEDSGAELWASDGTPAGTGLVLDVNPGLESKAANGEKAIYPGPSARSSYPAELTALGGRLFFAATHHESGRELWVTDGSPENTSLVIDLRPGPDSASPVDLIRVGERFFFLATDGVHGHELWVSDGTDFTRLTDLAPGPASADLSLLTAWGQELFFVTGKAADEAQLWASDGTPEGTRLVRDLAAAGATQADLLTAADDRLFFVAPTAELGTELWTSDGTAQGTRLVEDLYPGPGSSEPQDLAVIDGWLVFAASDGTTGLELWRSDGRVDGTFRLFDLNPGPASSGPAEMTALGDLVLFAAGTPEYGRELWAFDRAALLTNPLIFADGFESGSAAAWSAIRLSQE